MIIIMIKNGGNNSATLWQEAFDRTQIFRTLKSVSVRETIRNLISLRLNLPRFIFLRISSKTRRTPTS